MEPQVLVAIISLGSSVVVGLLALIGVIYSARKNKEAISSDTANQIKIAQAVTDTKIDALTEEVKMHNNFARRMPVVEEQIKVVNHRLEDLENKVG